MGSYVALGSAHKANAVGLVLVALLFVQVHDVHLHDPQKRNSGENCLGAVLHVVEHLVSGNLLIQRVRSNNINVTGQESLTYDSWFDHFWLTCPSRPDSGTFQVNQIYSCKMATYMFNCGYLAVCTARDLGWKRVHWIVHKCSRVLEQLFFLCRNSQSFFC